MKFGERPKNRVSPGEREDSGDKSRKNLDLCRDQVSPGRREDSIVNPLKGRHLRRDRVSPLAREDSVVSAAARVERGGRATANPVPGLPGSLVIRLAAALA